MSYVVRLLISTAVAVSLSRQTAMDVVGRRRIADAIPTLLAAADDSDEQIQVAAVKALGETIDFEQLSTLTDRITSTKNEKATAAAMEALKAACVRMPETSPGGNN